MTALWDQNLQWEFTEPLKVTSDFSLRWKNKQSLIAFTNYSSWADADRNLPLIKLGLCPHLILGDQTSEQGMENLRTLLSPRATEPDSKWEVQWAHLFFETVGNAAEASELDFIWARLCWWMEGIACWQHLCLGHTFSPSLGEGRSNSTWYYCNWVSGCQWSGSSHSFSLSVSQMPKA